MRQAGSHLANRPQALVSKELIAQMKEADQSGHLFRGLDAHRGDVILAVDSQRKSYDEK